MSKLADRGVHVDLPAGWEGQIRSAGQPGPGRGASSAAVSAERGAPVVLHAASFALPVERGDYGSGAVEVMGGSDVLVCLLEHDRADVSTPLFAREGIPPLTAASFSPQTMQRAIAGMAGSQHFFQLAGRAFCLYVVIGSWHTRGPLVRAADRVTSSIRVS